MKDWVLTGLTGLTGSEVHPHHPVRRLRASPLAIESAFDGHDLKSRAVEARLLLASPSQTNRSRVSCRVNTAIQSAAARLAIHDRHARLEGMSPRPAALQADNGGGVLLPTECMQAANLDVNPHYAWL